MVFLVIRQCCVMNTGPTPRQFQTLCCLLMLCIEGFMSTETRFSRLPGEFGSRPLHLFSVKMETLHLTLFTLNKVCFVLEWSVILKHILLVVAVLLFPWLVFYPWSFFPPACYVTIRRLMINLRRYEWGALWWNPWDSCCLISYSHSTLGTPYTRSVVACYLLCLPVFLVLSG